MCFCLFGRRSDDARWLCCLVLLDSLRIIYFPPDQSLGHPTKVVTTVIASIKFPEILYDLTKIGRDGERKSHVKILWNWIYDTNWHCLWCALSLRIVLIGSVFLSVVAESRKLFEDLSRKDTSQLAWSLHWTISNGKNHFHTFDNFITLSIFTFENSKLNFPVDDYLSFLFVCLFDMIWGVKNFKSKQNFSFKLIFSSFLSCQENRLKKFPLSFMID